MVVVVLYGTHAKAFDGHFHIRLSGTDPYLTAHHVIDGNRLTIVEGDGQRGIGCFWCLDLNNPLTVLIGF